MGGGAVGQPGRPKPALVLSEAQRHELEAVAREPPEHTRWLSLRCRIVLRSAQGVTNRQVARELGVSEAMVSKWRERYRTQGLRALYDDRRLGVPSSITDDQVQAVFVATLEASPPPGTRWTTRTMAEHTGISQSSVGRIWRTYKLGPGQRDIFTLSRDPGFVGRVRGVSGVFLNPPEGVLALGVDENAEVAATATATIPPLCPWARHSSDDGETATPDLHKALKAACGRVIAERAAAKRIERRRDADLEWFLDLVDKTVPEDLDVYVVMNHSATKLTEWLYDWLLDHLRFELHFVPTYSWWTAVVEWWFALLTNAELERSKRELVAEINEWVEGVDEDPRGFAWHWEQRGAGL